MLAVLPTVAGLACSGGGSSSGGTGGSSANASGGSTGNRTGGAGGGSAASGGAGGAGGSRFTTVAVCGQRGQATANGTGYDGWEEIFMTGDSGLGLDVCVVRYDVKRVGDAPAGCTECMWTDLVEYSNPTIVTNTNGACANSDLGLDMPAINRKVGTRLGLGFVYMYQGAHGSVRFIYDNATMMWGVSGVASWDTTMNNLFRYDNRDGLCNYDPLPAQ